MSTRKDTKSKSALAPRPETVVHVSRRAADSAGLRTDAVSKLPLHLDENGTWSPEVHATGARLSDAVRRQAVNDALIVITGEGVDHQMSQLYYR